MEPVIIFAQRTTAVALEELGVKCFIVIKSQGYEGSEEVTRQMSHLFKVLGITEVIPVAQPFLHLNKCIQLVKDAGFKTQSFWQLVQMIGWIGFDKMSVQPATRGPLRLVFYTIRQIVFGYRPPIEQSEP